MDRDALRAWIADRPESPRNCYESWPVASVAPTTISPI
jgi:hypothetical protein